MNTKHAPAPWKIGTPFNMAGMHHIFIYDSTGKVLGRIDGYENGKSLGESGYPDENQTIANALVMAAGPELLEALQAISIQFGYWKQQDKETNGYRWAVKAEEAIKKATGE